MSYVQLIREEQFIEMLATPIIRKWCRKKTILNPSNSRGGKKNGLNAVRLSPKKWFETTAAIGIISKSGRYIIHFGYILKKLNIPSRRINGNTHCDVVER
jgi:hypothetical protein